MIVQVNNALHWAGYSETHMMLAMAIIAVVVVWDFVQGVIRNGR